MKNCKQCTNGVWQSLNSQISTNQQIYGYDIIAIIMVVLTRDICQAVRARLSDTPFGKRRNHDAGGRGNQLHGRAEQRSHPIANGPLDDPLQKFQRRELYLGAALQKRSHCGTAPRAV